MVYTKNLVTKYTVNVFIILSRGHPMEPLKRASVRQHYDALIDENNDPARDPAPGRAYMDQWDGQAFLDELQLTREKDILEIGVGSGRLAVRTAPLCRTFFGIDLSPKSIGRAGENLRDYSNICLIRGNFLTYPFDRTFDVIYSSLTFLHIRAKRQAIRRVVSLLTPDGRFVLSISKSRDRLLKFNEREVTLYPDTPEMITALLADAGLWLEKRFETEFAVVFSAVRGKH